MPYPNYCWKYRIVRDSCRVRHKCVFFRLFLPVNQLFYDSLFWSLSCWISIQFYTCLISVSAFTIFYFLVRFPRLSCFARCSFCSSITSRLFRQLCWQFGDVCICIDLISGPIWRLLPLPLPFLPIPAAGLRMLFRVRWRDKSANYGNNKRANIEHNKLSIFQRIILR